MIEEQARNVLRYIALCNILKNTIRVGFTIWNVKRERIALITEFEERETKEVQFAFFCDKLVFEIQCRFYDEEGCVDLNYQPNNTTLNHPDVRRLLDQGKSFSEMMFEFGRERYNYDENFTEISKYAESHELRKII